MTDIETLFFELIRVAIGTQESLSHVPSVREWKELYHIAQKQALLGICFAGVQKLSINQPSLITNLSDHLRLQWMAMAAKIQQRNEVVNRQCVELQANLSANEFRNCILKGQGVAQLYHSLAGLRQSGDIDIWIDAPKEKLIDYVMGIAPTKEVDQKHIHFHCFDDTDVEAHWRPVLWIGSPKNKILQTYFENVREREFSNGGFPTTEFQLEHQLLHVYGHYVYEGVGLRQLMDLYFAQRATHKAPNAREQYDAVLALFRQLGMMRFVAATQWVLQEVFQLPNGELLCETDEKEGKKLLNEILIGGNFGHHNEANHVANESFMQRFFRRWSRKFRMFRFDPLGTLVMPFSRLKLEFWMRSVRRKYNV